MPPAPPSPLAHPDGLAVLGAVDVGSYAPVLLLIFMAITFAVANVAVSLVLGPRRSGAVKDTVYESGMTAVGSARKRFNVRFYLIAMIFLVFDIEIIFLYPWGVTFPNLNMDAPDALVWLGRIGFFLLTTVVAYIYGYRKGVFQFD